MKSDTAWKYVFNCFLLLIPIMAWNVILTNRLPAAFQPDVFWKDISPFLSYPENIFRTVVFGFTLLMPFNLVKPGHKVGLLLYAAGVLLYFTSWLILICFPNSAWSHSLPGFTAPAFTPFLWLAGIGFIGDSFYFRLAYKPWYFILISILFLVFHNIHTCIIYFRIYR